MLGLARLVWASLTVAAIEGVRSRVLEPGAGLGLVMVGLVLVGASKAPMSQTTVPSPSPSLRATPRWSVSGQSALDPPSTAGLLARRARVSVGPPLSWRGPRRGLVFCLSGGCVKPQLLSLLMLLPREEMVPPNSALLQLLSVLPATMVFFTKMVVPVFAVRMPPPKREDVLEAMVEFSMFMRAPSSAATPPLTSAWL